MRNQQIYCAGPHKAPVQLYDATMPDEIPANAPHLALCAVCGPLYLAGRAAPATIKDAGGADIPNPDKLAAGELPKEKAATPPLVVVKP